MRVGTFVVLAGMLQASPAASQVDTVSPSPPDTARGLGTRTVITDSLLRQLPIDDPREALTLAPGFVRRGTAFGIGAGTGLHLRGGGGEATAVYIDGAPVRNQITGIPGITLPLATVQTISVTRGVSDIDFADGAGGGVIEYRTQTGGSHLEGRLRAATDAPLGANSSVGYNRFSGTIGGPAGPRVRWFVAGEVTGQRSAYRGWGADKVPAFVWGGVDTIVDTVAIPSFIETTGLRRPLDWLTERRAVAKLVLNAGAGSQLTITGLVNDLQQRFFPGSDVGDIALFSGAHTSGRALIAGWTGSLGQPRTTLSLHVVAALAHDGSSSGLLTAASQSASTDPTLGIEWSSLAFLGSESIPQVTDQIIRNIRSNVGLRVPFLNQTSLRNVQPYRLNPYGLVSGWPTGGSNGSLSQETENRFNGRAWAEWAIPSRQRVRAGVDYDHASQRMYQSDLLNQIDMDAWIAHPQRLGVFAADRLDWGPIVVDLGLRFDHFTPGGILPVVPGRIFSNPAWGAQTATDDTAYAASLARVYRTASGTNSLSPRLQIAYLPWPHTTVRLSLGQTTEPPTSNLIFGGSNDDLSFSNTSAPFGRDVKYIRVTTAEVGVSRALTTQLRVGLDGYHTTRALYPYRIQAFNDPANPGRSVNLNVPTALDSLATNGIEADVEWAPPGALSGRLVYSFEHSEGFSAQAFAALIQVIAPRGFTAVGSINAHSGLPYIPGLATVPNGDDEFPVYSINALQRLPWTSMIDLRLTKSVRLQHLEGTLFADVRNALDFRNVLGAFVRTGSQTDTIFQALTLSPEFASLHIEAQANGVLISGNAIDLRPDCSTWTATAAGMVDCAMLRRVERRFGNGDGVYDMTEQTTALNAYFEAFFGAAQFYAPGRTARIGLEIRF